MPNHAQRQTPNHLRAETSPYLQQHAYNPVDWYPWGPEALEKARHEDKPILLSIGYSSCHWCHVMAHESFEDFDTARVMNELFVNIKVDREERPDLDKIYQTAHQLLMQRPGGWPLNVLLSPEDQTPFFSGTYFPKRPRYGMPAFVELLRGVEAYYRRHRNDIQLRDASLHEALEQMERLISGRSPVVLDPSVLERAREQLDEHYDAEHGGFGGAPKFPQPTSLALLLGRWARYGDERARSMAVSSLQAMYCGGIYDQLGGGFFRYAVDAGWEIPHFEKMLYDNAALLGLYAEAWQATGNPAFKRIAKETAAWVQREMEAPEGGYYSALDADSEGEEGRYYLWSRDRIEALLDAGEYRVAARRFGLEGPANFEGAWHLRVVDDAPLDEPRWRQLEAARAKLLREREGRAHPGRDEKILTAWNALMIKGMATAGRCLGHPALVDSAERALDLIRGRLLVDGRLRAVYRQGEARLNGYLDDYAFTIDAVLALLQARWRDGDLGFAQALAETLLAHFQDAVQGGFFFTADDHERLIHRPRPMIDEATPSGNGVAAQVLIRLGHLLGEPRYLDAAERTLKAAWRGMEQVPQAYGALLLALEEQLEAPQILVLRGEDKALRQWRTRIDRHYAPQRLVLAIPSSVQDLPGLLGGLEAPQQGAIAYHCAGSACGEPLRDLRALERHLAAGAERAAAC